MLSFKQLDKSRLFAILVDKDEKFKENLFINEHRAKKLVQDEDFKKRISDYAEEVEVNENGIVTSFILKDDYKLVPTPPNFGEKENQRMVCYIVGRAGSGKSYYTANLLKYYNHMYKKNSIYYVLRIRSLMTLPLMKF
jgi:polynucleotide 5'-kinase involved in rRNA processing